MVNEFNERHQNRSDAMPLMLCPDCGKEISDSAISCPNCGLPRPYYELQSRARRQQEAEALQDHRAAIRNLYIAAAVLGLGALGLLVAVLASPWTRLALATKGKEALLALLLGAVAYLLFRQARTRGTTPPLPPKGNG